MATYYTRKGDKGTSSVYRKSIPKNNPLFNALGAVDELNSLIGVVKNQGVSKSVKLILESIQEDLFIIQAEIANVEWGQEARIKNQESFIKMTPEKIDGLEKIIDDIEKKIKPEKKFIIPGTNKNSAWLDYARTVCRRAEREIVNLEAWNIKHETKKMGLNPEIIKYVNRLSSVFYALARFEGQKTGRKEGHPKYR